MVKTFEEAADVVRNTLQAGYPQVKKAYIFGSFAKALQKPDSDLDIMVELDQPMGFAFYGMADAIEEAVGRPVDLLTTSHARHLEAQYEYYMTSSARCVYERPAN